MASGVPTQPDGSSASAKASAMKELKRKATCAPDACVRASTPGHQRNEYANATPPSTVATPAKAKLAVAAGSRGVRRMELNSNTGNSR